VEKPDLKQIGQYKFVHPLPATGCIANAKVKLRL